MSLSNLQIKKLKDLQDKYIKLSKNKESLLNLL